MNHLHNNFYTMPKYATAIMTTEQLRETLLATGGDIIACGETYDIKNEHLGAGVYKMFLKKRYFRERT